VPVWRPEANAGDAIPIIARSIIATSFDLLIMAFFLITDFYHPTLRGYPDNARRDNVLDDFTLYRLTNTAVSAARYYWEGHINLYDAANVSIPAAVSAFPGENYQAPRSWTERAYHNLIYYSAVDEGGHYAAWEQPQLFSKEVRAGFKPLRK
jgi:pimeloyl-ACP methyl ester carboxylesterase